MKRLSLNAPRWLVFASLLAFVTLAGSSSFLHTCHPQDDDQGVCDHQGIAPQSRDLALSLLTVGAALTATHHGDCLACQWGTNTRQPVTLPTDVSAFTPGAPARPPAQLRQYTPSVHTPSGIRGPPQA